MTLSLSLAVLEARRPPVDVATHDSLPTGRIGPTGPTGQRGTDAALNGSTSLRESVSTAGNLTHTQQLLIGEQALMLMEEDMAALLASDTRTLRVDVVSVDAHVHDRPWGSTDVADGHPAITVDGVPGARVVRVEGLAADARTAARTRRI